MILISTFAAHAIVSSPDGGNYVYQDSTTYSWVEINTSGTSITLTGTGTNKASSTKIPLGFTFNYYGTDYESLYVMSAGWVSFTDQEEDKPSLDAFPHNGDACAGVIAPLALTYTTTLSGGFYYETKGSAPNRTFIVEYYYVFNNFNNVDFTFEIIFYELNNQIKFQYNSLASGAADTSLPETSHVGIESPDETAGLEYGQFFEYNQIPPIYSGQAIRFGHPLEVTIPWGDTTVDSTYVIGWDEICANGDAEITLYYDDGTDTTGTLITDTLTVSDGNQVLWAPQDFTDTTIVYIYAVLVNGTDTTVSYGPGQITFSQVPVVLASFTAQAEGSNAVLAWQTVSEENNLGFNVLRSSSVAGPFGVVNAALIPGQGTTSQPHLYTFTDAGLAAGTWYYKVEQVDITGEKTYSGVRTVTIGNTGLNDRPLPVVISREDAARAGVTLLGLDGQPVNGPLYKGIYIYRHCGRLFKTIINE